MSQSPRRSALITGATGQDGAYLAELLLSKGYVVHGIKRRSSSFNTARVDHLYHDPHEQRVRFHLHYGDATDAINLIRIVQETQPDEIYNLAAQSHVHLVRDARIHSERRCCWYAPASGGNPLERYSGESPVNIGTGEEITITDLARLISQVIGYRGELVFDPSRPDGTPRKLLNVSKLRALGWKARTPLAIGLERTYADFLALNGQGGT